MSKMGYGYGSECHLLRWMGRHRTAFDKAVLSEIGRVGYKIQWLDFKFSPGDMWADAELKGMDFLGSNESLQESWKRFWPVGGGIHNWDAVGWVVSNEIRELLLVEAKAHIGETKTSCQAKDAESIGKIKGSFDVVKNALEIPNGIDWMKGYYQVTNRISALYFLHQQNVPSHLLFIYFIGDLCGSGRSSPQSKGEWQEALDAKNKYIGLPENHSLERWIHELFLKIDSDREVKGNESLNTPE